MRSSLFESLLASGLAGIEDLVAEERAESLHLEFKTIASTNGLTREDRKMIAKAVCGFSNAEGGLLLLGIETTKADGLDVASRLRPVNGVSRFQNQVRSALPEMLSPQHSAIRVETIGDDRDVGFLLIDVPASNNRPHMSLSEQRYFRRGSDGTRVLIHGEVRDLMFVEREGSQEIKCSLRSGVSQGDTKFQLWLRLDICNVGRIPIIAPYIRTNANLGIPESLQPRTVRDHNEGVFGIYTTRDVVLHVGQAMTLGETPTGLDFTRTGQSNLTSAIASIKKGGIDHAFSMVPWGQMAHGSQNIPPPQETPIYIVGTSGGMNAPANGFELRVGKHELLGLFEQHKGLRTPSELS
ncbi:hypothetical protein ACVINW_004182 [Bradyrhizobium sp. USDA 4461]